MAVEIERRFLVKNEAWRGLVTPKLLYQGYLSVEKERTMRVRIVGDEAWVTIKGYISDVSRHEFEYAIPVQDALTILEQMCPFKMKKHRYCIEHQGHVFEVDEYFGDNAPLVVAEIELATEDTAFARPEWLGEEITHDGRFTNAYLSQHPYTTW
ncbi:CYTH domain-containing protein [Vitreoscilla massiliensis]|uniref:CYTH domain-containing protein n=1 Tax=Vitreoscilla massiliensis TaxID=1689272 RepID=A0ABY4E692_9NEIS|nr:CYTH domain-containing protein [Vitreoscilla massiliensis]UOO90989.1 CYTH domain-containing protein [Vitreoscilla massiliensis]